MSISTQTWRVWTEISERVEAHVLRTIRDRADAEDVISEIRIMFIEGNCGVGYAPGQALKYCLHFLKKQVLRQLGLVAVRRTIGKRGAYTAALEGAEFEEDLTEIEDALRPHVDHISYEELVDGGRTPEGWNSYVDPMNPYGYDERICEYLESPIVDKTAKQMARMMLAGHTQREVAVTFGTSEQTVQRHLSRESVKLESRTVIRPPKAKKAAPAAARVTQAGEGRSNEASTPPIRKTTKSGPLATAGIANLANLGKTSQNLRRTFLTTRKVAGLWPRAGSDGIRERVQNKIRLGAVIPQFAR